VWFDESELRLGDSLVQKIDEGLAASTRGILVLSPAFLGKRWTEYERQGLTGRDVDSGGRVIIPIWHGVTAEQVSAFSPTLAQRFALVTDGLHVDEIALRLLDEIRPDLAESAHRAAAFDRLLRPGSSELTLTSTGDLRRPEEPLHDVLAAPLLRRIRLVQEAVYEVFPVSFEETVDNFKRDIRPEREVEFWESIAGIYLNAVREQRVTTLEARRELFQLVLGGSSLQDLNKIPIKHLDPELAAAVTAFYEGVRASRAKADEQTAGGGEPR
jgi:hypothetical protein